MDSSANIHPQPAALYQRLQASSQQSRTRRRRLAAMLQRLRNRAAFAQALRAIESATA